MSVAIGVTFTDVAATLSQRRLERWLAVYCQIFCSTTTCERLFSELALIQTVKRKLLYSTKARKRVVVCWKVQFKDGLEAKVKEAILECTTSFATARAWDNIKSCTISLDESPRVHENSQLQQDYSKEDESNFDELNYAIEEEEESDGEGVVEDILDTWFGIMDSDVRQEVHNDNEWVIDEVEDAGDVE